MIGGMFFFMYTFDFDFFEASFYAELYNVFAAPCSVAGETEFLRDLQAIRTSLPSLHVC